MALPKENKYTAEEFFKVTSESDIEQYELINGQIVAQAAPSTFHQRITGGIYRKIGNFIEENKGKCEPFISPLDVKLDDYNVVQPDVFVVCDPSKLDDKRCNGAPDWCIEVLSTNRRDDLVEKLALYSKFGVREYWIVDPKNEKSLVYFFEKSDFPSIYAFDSPIPVGIYDSRLSLCISDLL